MKSFHPDEYANDVAEDDLYAGLLTGDHWRAKTKSISDMDYARLYVGNLFAHLHRLDFPTTGGVVDAGCGMGTIAKAFHEVRGKPVWGIDMSPAAMTYAAKTFDGPTFINGSAHDLRMVPDGSLALYHAREFYPFSRSSDADLHRMFLDAARPKLAAGGLFAIVQIKDPSVGKGLQDHASRIHDLAIALGYRRAGVMTMVPQFLARKTTTVFHSAPMYSLVWAAGQVLERLKPGKVSYIYWLQA